MALTRYQLARQPLIINTDQNDFGYKFNVITGL